MATNKTMPAPVSVENLIGGILVWAIALALAVPAMAQAPDTESSDREAGERIAELANTASGLADRGEYIEAETIFRQAFDIANAQFATDHPEVTTARINLATVLYNMGRAEEAEPLARQSYGVAIRDEEPDSQTRLQSANIFSRTLIAIGQPGPAAEIFASFLPTYRQVYGEEDQVYLFLRINHAQALGRLGDTRATAEMQAENLRLLQRHLGDSHILTAHGLADYGLSLRRLGRSEDSIPLLRRAVEVYSRVLDAPNNASLNVAQSLAGALQDIGETGQALLLYQDTLALAEEHLPPGDVQRTLALNNLAMAYFELEMYAEAAPLMARALETSSVEEGELGEGTLSTMANYAVTLQSLDRLDEALPLLERALQLRRWGQGDKHPATIDAAFALGRFHLTDGAAPQTAYDYSRIAVEGVRERRRLMGVDPYGAAQQQRELRQFVQVYEDMLEAAWFRVQADPMHIPEYEDMAFGVLQDLIGGSAAGAIARSAARQAAEDEGGLGQLARERQELADRWTTLETDMTRALPLPGRDGERTRERLRSELADVERRLQRLDDQLQQESPSFFAVTRQQPLTISEAQALLAEDEAAVMLVPTPFGTHVFAVTADDYFWHRSNWDRGTVDQVVRRLQFDLGFESANSLGEYEEWLAQQEGEGPYPYSFEYAHAAYEELIFEIEEVIRDKSHVFVMAQGPLASMPLGVLAVTVPEWPSGEPETLRSALWLADRYALVTVPNLPSIRYLREFAAAPEARPASFLGFGDPVLAGSAEERGGRLARDEGGFAQLFSAASPATSRGERGVANSDALRALSQLPGTATELQSMWNAFGQPANALYLRESARERDVKRMALEAEVIAFATHGLMAGEISSVAEPGLVLTPPDRASLSDDGYLSMSEIAELDINAEWVILSACNTAAGDGGPADDALSGLARAFLFAGARSLLVSHWPVRDDVAAVLTVRTVELTRADPTLSRAQAFQQAMVEIRNDPQHDDWAHPSAWAPFVLVGDR